MLYGKHLAGSGYTGYFFSKAWMKTQIILNERGVKTESLAKTVLRKGPKPKTLILSKPFLFTVRNSSDHLPYFSAWIGNTGSMETLN